MADEESSIVTRCWKRIVTARIIIRNAAQLVCVATRNEHVKRGRDMNALAIIEDGAIVIEEERISWVGRTADLTTALDHAEEVDTKGKVVLPGLIDSHTHLLFAGSREN